MGGSPTKIPKDEDEKQGEKNGPGGQTAQDDLDDMEITKLWMFVSKQKDRYLFEGNLAEDDSGAQLEYISYWSIRFSKIKQQTIITIFSNLISSIFVSNSY